MSTQKYTIALNASSTAINITNDKNSLIYSISGEVNAFSIPTAISGVSTIVLMSANTTPNQVGQNFSMPSNQIVLIGGVDTSAYTPTQILNAIQSLGGGVGDMSVTIVGAALTALNAIASSTNNIDSSTANSSNSLVNINSDTTVIKNSVGSIDSKIPASPATSGKQDTGNTSLASIDGKIPAKGSAASAASTPVVIASDQADIPVNLKATSSQTGALSLYSAATTTAVLSASIKGSAGRLGFISVFNYGSTPAYIRVYNQNSAPAAGDTANIIYRGVIPANNSNGSGFIQPIIIGVGCSAGIGIRVTGGSADNDNTALVSTNQCFVNIAYS